MGVMFAEGRSIVCAIRAVRQRAERKMAVLWGDGILTNLRYLVGGRYLKYLMIESQNVLFSDGSRRR